jgi:photosystem II stability/assembly factor-like uncharacterized protein
MLLFEGRDAPIHVRPSREPVRHSIQAKVKARDGRHRRSLMRLICAWIVVAWPIGLFAQEQSEHAAAHEDIWLREAYFRSLHESGGGSSPDRRYVRAVEATRRAPRNVLFNFRVPPAIKWTSIGPFNLVDSRGQSVAGRVLSIALDPRVRGTAVIGAAAGGIWRTTDAGAHWDARTDNLCAPAVGTIVFDPTNPSRLFAGTGEANGAGDAYFGCSVLSSKDGGLTWHELGWDTFSTVSSGARIAKLVVFSRQSADSTVLVAATSYGIYRSSDAGVSWTLTLSGLFTDITSDFGSTPVLYAAAGDDIGSTTNGVFVSADSGKTWYVQTDSLPAPTRIGHVALAASRAVPGVVYAAIAAAGTNGHNPLIGLYQWRPNGEYWRRLPAERAECGQQCWYDMAVTVDPTDGARVFFSGITLYLSSDSGKTFNDIGAAMHADHHALVVDPQHPLTIWAATDGGVYRSEDGGQRWTSLNRGLGIAQFYPGIALNPTTGGILGGTQDNGVVEYDGQGGWAELYTGDGGFSAIDPRETTTEYAEIQWDTTYGGPLRKDALSNGEWINKRDGIDLQEQAAFIPPLAIDPAHSNILYFGTTRVYRSLDRGDHWDPIPGSLSGEELTSIAVSPSDSGTVYVGTFDGGIYVRAHGLWSKRGYGLPFRPVLGMAIDPADPRHAFAVEGGWGPRALFVTADGGDSWANTGPPGLVYPANAVAFLWDRETIAVGTEKGVILTTDGGTNWSTLGTLPSTPITALVYDPARRRLIAATHGRGVFVWVVPEDFAQSMARATLAAVRSTVRGSRSIKIRSGNTNAH